MPFLASNITKEKYSSYRVTEILNKTRKLISEKLPFYQFSWVALIFMKFFFGWICYIIINFFAKFHRNLLTLPVLCISGSCIEIEINLNFYLHTSLWCFKRFYQGLWGLHKTFRGTTKKSENKHLVNFFFEFFFLWYGWPTKSIYPYFQLGPLSEILTIMNL